MKILQEIDNPLLTYYLHPVTVLTFRDKEARIEVGEEEYRAITLPYTTSTSVEGRLVDSMEKLSNGDILLVEFPKDVDDAKFIVIKAMNRGADGIIFIDRVDAYRRIVVSLEEEYTYSTGNPIKIPVIAVPRSIGEKLRSHVGKKARIRTEVDYKWCIGYNIEITVTEGEELLLLTAHFDHWLTGMLDNSLGVGSVLSLIDDILTGSKVGVKIILFTAEEIGIPNMASMYWTWGSKSYLEYLTSNKLIHNIMFIINVDVIGKKPYIYTTEDIYSQIRILEMEQSAPYFDTLNFEIVGIPCITISSLRECWDIYHTDLEREDNIDIRYVDETIRAIYNIFRKLNDNKLRIDYGIYLNKVKRSLEKLGIILRADYTYESYRDIRGELSKNIVIWRKDDIEVTYSEDIVSKLAELSHHQDLIKVTELGTGLRLLSGPGDIEFRRFVNYLREVIKYRILR